MPFNRRLPVLVVEDEDFTAEVVEALLVGIGFEHVDRAADGLDAWTMMRQRRYALVVSDYRMAPMNGLMFLQSVREDPDLQDTRILLLTAASAPEIRREAERLGADAFLLKPFTPKALRVSLEAMMRQPRVRVA